MVSIPDLCLRHYLYCEQNTCGEYRRSKSFIQRVLYWLSSVSVLLETTSFRFFSVAELETTIGDEALEFRNIKCCFNKTTMSFN